jgi:hypothetical protein
MTLAGVWSTYMQILRERAPVTAASIRPPCAAADVLAAERMTAPWTEELREFYRLQDGQDATYAGGSYSGEALPDLRLYPLDEAVALHSWWLKTRHSTEHLGPNWLAEVRDQGAGESAATFLPEYIPVAEGFGGLFAYIDTRRGLQCGCVRFFSAEGADEEPLAYESLSAIVQQVTESLENGSAHRGSVPSITDGTLSWELDPDG